MAISLYAKKKKAVRLLLVGVLLLAKVSMCQPEVHNPALLLAKVPFQLLPNGIVIVKAAIGNSADTLNFILDTGSAAISLDSATAAQLQIDVSASATRLHSIGATRTVSYARNISLLLPGLAIEHLDCYINNYSLLAGVYGIAIHGVIGYSLLSRYIVRLNYDANEMELYSQGSFSYPAEGSVITPIMNRIPLVRAEVADATTRAGSFIFDTGGGLCLLMPEEVANGGSFFLQNKKRVITQADAPGGKNRMTLSTVAAFTVGQYTFRNVPVHLFTDDAHVMSYHASQGLIGNDLLRRFNLVLDYRAGTIHMQPNRYFYEPFDYSYTGLGIYYSNGAVVIEDVIPHSPGAKAGLQSGDKIASVNGVAVTDVPTCTSLLRAPGQKLRLRVLRNGKPVRVRLVADTIL